MKIGLDIYPDVIFELSLDCMPALVMQLKGNTLKLKPCFVFSLTDLKANVCLCGGRS